MIRTEVNYNVAEEECPPDPERVIEGLRDTGYNFNTAVADVVDNSIAAGATKVDIWVNMAPDGTITVYIADNGTGMDEEGLKNAMKYGSKVRADLASLGKFGLGLKTASTAFCRCLSVVSRSIEDKTVRKAQWDLDYVASVNSWKLKYPQISQDEIDLLDSTTNGESGTLVVWEKVDRLLKNYANKGNAQNALKKKLQELEFHLSMVYQRFLDMNDKRAENVEITLNGSSVSAWDPFITSEEMTERLAADDVDVELPDGATPSFSMQAYMIPRGDDFSTPKAKENARLSNDMQGFYVYRENRLIHYGDWLGMFAKEPHLTLLRVEFSFDHMLDSAFNVDIKKSRILPAEEILEYIKKEFIPAPRRAAEERYRKGTAKQAQGEAAKRDAHAASNRNIEEKAKSVEEAKVSVTDNNEVKVENQHGEFTHKITIISNSKPGQMRVVTVPTLESNQLWEPCIVDGKQAVQINQSHPYYQKVYYPVLSQNVMVTGMDALLWALASAEHATYNEETKEHYEDMRIAVSRILKKLVADLPDPEEESEE